LSKIEGLARLRYTTSHPRDMDDDLIAAHGDLPNLMPSLHLPVQSGSNRVLKAMNRQHTVADYLKTIEKIRKARPDMAFSSDFIVGFPGETEADFLATLDLCHQVDYAMAYSFVYSARPGTPAAGREEVADDIKAERLQRIQALLTDQQTAFQKSMVGRTLPVLVEKPGRVEGQLVGKTPWLHTAHFSADAALIGRVVEVEILRSDKNTLAGQIAKLG
jgi:tRNA-2-methylthio-N6-dimethylallyladenosine synthase